MPEIRQLESAEPTYSTLVGAAYIFNLIVGTGALTIPAAFAHAGWLASTVIMAVLACIGYLTTTFVVEAMSSANAVLYCQERKFKQIQDSDRLSNHSSILEADSNESSSPTSDQESEEETTRLLNPVADTLQATTPPTAFSLQKRVEMGQMASMFFSKGGLVLFYCTICVYLWGDLAIYGTAVSKTLRDIACTYTGPNNSCNSTLLPAEQCWNGASVSRENAYRIFLAIFIVCAGSFVFFNVQKTKILQLFTTLLRWLAFGVMVVLACNHLAGGRGRGHPTTFHFLGLPNLFGVCIYSFMSHHSLPALITPLADKRAIHRMMAINYAAILVFYLLVALTGVFSFSTLRDLYTLNFEPSTCGDSDPDLPTDSTVIQYFLSLFPVFTLTTNFPIIAITLRNNMIQLWRLVRGIRLDAGSGGRMERLLMPLLAVLPPACVSLATEDVQMLVGVTGSFGGMAVQYVIPTLLVHYSRRATAELAERCGGNYFRSFFRHGGWLVFTLVWTVACLVMIVSNYILKATQG